MSPRNTIPALLCVLALAASTWALHEITLENGRTLTGEILSETESFFVIDRGGSVVRILKRIIVEIDGKRFGSSEPDSGAVPGQRAVIPEARRDSADRLRAIVLKNGTKLNGAIVAESARFITLDLSGARLKIIKSLIASLDGKPYSDSAHTDADQNARAAQPSASAASRGSFADTKTGRRDSSVIRAAGAPAAKVERQTARAPAPLPDAASSKTSRIRLKNGAVIEGVIADEHAGFYTVSVDHASIKVLKTMVADIQTAADSAGVRPPAPAKPISPTVTAPRNAPRQAGQAAPASEDTLPASGAAGASPRAAAAALDSAARQTAPSDRHDDTTVAAGTRSHSSPVQSLEAPVGRMTPGGAEPDTSRMRTAGARDAARADSGLDSLASAPVSSDTAAMGSPRPIASDGTEPAIGPGPAKSPVDLAKTAEGRAVPAPSRGAESAAAGGVRPPPGRQLPENAATDSAASTHGAVAMAPAKDSARDATVKVILRSVDRPHERDAAAAAAGPSQRAERPPVSQNRLSALREQLAGGGAARRITAALACARMGERAASTVAPLIDCLDDTAAAPQSMRDSLGNDGIPGKLTPARAASEALRKIGAPAVNELRKALRHRKAVVRRHATRALCGIQTRASTEALVEALGDEDIDVQFAARAELLRRRPVALLLEAATAPGASMRKNALDILGELAVADASPAVIASLDDRNAAVREMAAKAAGQIGASGAGQKLIQLLDDNISFVRAHAAFALGSLRFEQAVEPLIETLKDNSGIVRERAARALGVFRDTRAIEPLAAAARDNNPDVRAAAGAALELHTDIGLLIEALDESSPLVRKNAEYALFLMTGRDFGADSQRWRQWKNTRAKQPEE